MKNNHHEDEMLRTFARGISHNFNNLLTAGIGFLSLAMDEVKDREVLGYLRNVELCHQRIGYLSKQLLAFTGDEEINIKPLHLYDSVRSVVNLFDAIALHQRTVLICDFGQLNNVIVQVDEFKLVQALMQILNNAAEAIDKQGRIEFYGYVEGDQVVIEIKDNGRGMTAEDVEKAFSPFYTTKQLVGVGMGLSTTCAIIESFHGTLSLESEPGEGTTARMTLPVYTEKFEESADEGAVLREGLSVLLAVDAPQTRDALEAVLMSFAFNVELADCQQTLIEQLSGSRIGFDVVVADLLNGELFGDSLIDLIRSYTKIPVINLYASRSELPVKSYENVEYLQKPFSPPNLLSLLNNFPSLQA